MKTRHAVLIIFILGFFFNIYYLLQRMTMEQNYNFVETAYFVNELEVKASRQGLDLIEFLKNFSEKVPVSTLIFTPSTLRTLENKETLMVFKGREILKSFTMEGFFNPLVFELSSKTRISEIYQYVYFKKREDFEKIRVILQEYFPPDSLSDLSEILRSFNNSQKYGYLLEVKSGNDLLDLPLFFSAEDFQVAKKMGFMTAACLDFRAFSDPHSSVLKDLLRLSQDLDEIYLQPEPGELTPDQLKTLEGIKAAKVRLAVEEFSYPKVQRIIFKLFEAQLIRAHEAPIEIFCPEKASALVHRYFRAAWERNVRVMVFHLFPDNGIEQDQSFAVLLKKTLSRTLLPLTIRKNEPLGPVPESPSWFKILVISVLAMMFFLVMIDPLIELSLNGKLVIIVLSSMLLACGTFFAEKYYFEKILAQFISFFFPIFGFFHFQKIYSLSKTHTTWEYYKTVLGYLLFFTLITVYGSLLIAGLFNSRVFIMKIEEFRSVKLALLVPVAMLALFLILQYSSKEKIREFFYRPINLLNLCFLCGVTLIIGLLIIRSGNIPQAYIPDYEMRIRNFLENCLSIRPRFKEFMLGYPVFLTAFCFKGFWRYFLLILSTLGQISVLNTFVHLHTPLAISLVRVFNGLAIGLLIGSALFFLINFLQEKQKR
ncbi:MAG: DUF5693 family protein [Candidatus Wallbacteria bacterium]|nr:DUF5693 family protein [Candidatus Wallbacteria bacterium]